MLQEIAAVVQPEMVAERHYFMELLNTPQVIGALRAVFIAAVLGALFFYKKMKQENED